MRVFLEIVLSLHFFLTWPSKANPPMQTVLERIFGSGEIIHEDHRQGSHGHVTSSMEDLIALCRYEQSQLPFIHSLPNVMGLIGNFLLGPSLLVSLITLPLLQIDELNKSTFIFDSFFLQQEIAEELPKKLLAQEN